MATNARVGRLRRTACPGRDHRVPPHSLGSREPPDGGLPGSKSRVRAVSRLADRRGGVSPNAARTPRAIVWLDSSTSPRRRCSARPPSKACTRRSRRSTRPWARRRARRLPRARRRCATAERRDHFQRRPVRFDVTLCFSNGNDAGRRAATGVEAVAAIWSDRWMP